jgi:phosphopantetheinyl transferase
MSEMLLAAAARSAGQGTVESFARGLVVEMLMSSKPIRSQNSSCASFSPSISYELINGGLARPETVGMRLQKLFVSAHIHTYTPAGAVCERIHTHL